MHATDRAFRIVPLGCLLAAAILSLLFRPGWSMRMAAVPWLVALVAVGLPHGAADLAVTRRLCGRPAALRVFAIYAASMAAVLLGFVAAPRLTVTLFAAVSIWHFGLSHAQGQSPPPSAAWRWQAVAATARGASVLGVPLAAWPAGTSAVIAHLSAFVHRAGTGPPPAFDPAMIHLAGVWLVLAGLIALSIEAWAFRRTPGGPERAAETLVDLLIIGLLGATADPLFSIGLYFLCWHAWREMRPLMAVIAPRTGTGMQGEGPGPALLRNVAAVHVAALPLLIPTWTCLAACWWLLSPTHSARDLAVLSLAVYLVVTPAHETLQGLLRADGPLRPRTASPNGLPRTALSPFRQPAHSCIARSVSS